MGSQRKRSWIQKFVSQIKKANLRKPGIRKVHLLTANLKNAFVNSNILYLE